MERRPRKFVIQSTFGNPRERRSRKNRPCDACRRRKTACVMTSEPPCLFCQSRGIVCQSTTPYPQQAQHSRGYPPLTSSSLLHQPSPAEVPTPSTVQDSPRPASAVCAGGEQHPQAYAAAAVHENLVYHAGRPAAAAAASSPPPRSLEDMAGRSAYYMGPSSEQDPFLLDAFRYGILSEKSSVDANIVQVHAGSATPDDRPVHFLLKVAHPEHVDGERQAASDAIEAKVWPYGEHLVRLFFRHVHPVLPVVSKACFLRRYDADKKSVSACLRGALYAMACVFWRLDAALRTTPCPFDQHDLVDHAHAALRRDIENPNLLVLQAYILLIHVTPPTIDSIEAPTTCIFAAQAAACAQLIGLHQDPAQWNIEPVEKRLRRKLWWAAFVTDCWSSVCHGSPPHIAATSFTTLPLTMDDMRSDEDVPDELCHLVEPPDASFDLAAGARFMEVVNIARQLRTVLDCSL